MYPSPISPPKNCSFRGTLSPQLLDRLLVTWPDRSMRTVVMVLAGLLLGPACGPKPDNVDRDAVCSPWCENYVDPTCGPPPEEKLFATVEECMETCTDDNDLWEKECVDEKTEQFECVVALSCSEQREHFADASTSPCFDEVVAYSACRTEHNGG